MQGDGSIIRNAVIIKIPLIIRNSLGYNVNTTCYKNKGQSMSMSHIVPFVDASRKKIKKKILIDFNVNSYDELSDSDK